MRRLFLALLLALPQVVKPILIVNETNKTIHFQVIVDRHHTWGNSQEMTVGPVSIPAAVIQDLAIDAGEPEMVESEIYSLVALEDKKFHIQGGYYSLTIFYVGDDDFGESLPCFIVPCKLYLNIHKLTFGSGEGAELSVAKSLQ